MHRPPSFGIHVYINAVVHVDIKKAVVHVGNLLGSCQHNKVWENNQDKKPSRVEYIINGARVIIARMVHVSLLRHSCPCTAVLSSMVMIPVCAGRLRSDRTHPGVRGLSQLVFGGRPRHSIRCLGARFRLVVSASPVRVGARLLSDPDSRGVMCARCCASCLCVRVCACAWSCLSVGLCS